MRRRGVRKAVAAEEEDLKSRISKVNLTAALVPYSGSDRLRGGFFTGVGMSPRPVMLQHAVMPLSPLNDVPNPVLTRSCTDLEIAFLIVLRIRFLQWY
jgi:hypothetical protein